jgi:TRAP transporter TAXI family solute receptor
MSVRLLATSLALLFSFSLAIAQQPPKPKPAAPKAPAPTVGIISGDLDSTGTLIANDLLRVLDDGSTLRIVPMLGRGASQAINDLLNVRIVDIAILQSDVMARVQKQKSVPGLENRMLYIAKLYSEEFHVLARMQMTCLKDLTNRRVSFGLKESGSSVTAEAVFEAHGIKVEPQYFDHDEAVDKLKRGEIDAIAFVGGKPSRAFDKITYKDKVHFLDVEYLPSLRGTYLPAIITSEDYANLVAPTESVATISVPSVMAVANWPAASERFKVMTRFTERLFEEINRLKSGSYSPKWREVNLQAPVKGWSRFQPAERWLVANAQANTQTASQQTAAQKFKVMLQQFVESQRGATSNQEELFNQFVRWYQTQAAQQQ